jgi:hypothetical protein
MLSSGNAKVEMRRESAHAEGTRSCCSVVDEIAVDTETAINTDFTGHKILMIISNPVGEGRFTGTSLTCSMPCSSLSGLYLVSSTALLSKLALAGNRPDFHHSYGHLPCDPITYLLTQPLTL